MPLTLIQQNPKFSREVVGEDKLAIAEMFCDTIQGEGVSSGVPSTFIRLQGCTLKCVWCDTLEVWPYGNEYSFDEIFKLFEAVGLIDRFKQGQHIILTGGSPLKQQKRLIKFLQGFKTKYGFLPFTEIENEAVLMPDEELVPLIDQWNNSPKTSNSGMKPHVRIKPDILEYLNSLNYLNNYDVSYFKFVVQNEEDWKEIENDFLPHIDREYIILMPEGQTQEELSKTREIVADIAIREGVRFTDRLHVTIWNKKTGV